MYVWNVFIKQNSSSSTYVNRLELHFVLITLTFKMVSMRRSLAFAQTE